jgi:hypothetical protein
MNYLKNIQFNLQSISLKYIITVLTIIIFSTIISIFVLMELLLHIFYHFVIFSKYAYLCYPLLIVLCIMPLIVYHPVYALLLLIGVFLDTAIVLLILRVQFLSIIYIIIYIGAIAILFLFVLMMFNLKNLHNPIQMKYLQ